MSAHPGSAARLRAGGARPAKRTSTSIAPRGAASKAALAAALVGALIAAPLAVPPLAAQIADTSQTPVDSVVVTPEAEPAVVPAEAERGGPLTPTQALVRSMAVPGWGQAAFGSYVRGGVYFSGWAANWFMIFRNQVRLNDARSRYDRRVDQIIDEEIAASPDPDSTRAVLEADPSAVRDLVRADVLPGGADELRKLVRAREQQREDWIAWSIFWILASGIDGFVTAHLADFPADIELSPERDRSLRLEVRVPLPVPGGGTEP